MDEIGEILKEARIEQGYTLEDLQQTTKIQRRYLEAIEEGNLEILPGRFYARAFIKQYADIVGLDGEKLLNEYANQTPKEASEEFAENVNVQPTRTKAKRNDFLDNISEYLPTILIILLVAAIFLVIYFAWIQTRPSDENQAMINEENTEQVSTPTTEENEEATAESESDAEGAADTANEDENADESAEDENAEEEEEESEPAQEVSVTESTGSNTTFEVTGEHPETQTITLSASGGNSWVSIEVEGGATEQALLEDGDTISADFPGTTNSIRLVIGEATNTEVALNGEPVQYAPEAEGVITQRIQFQFEQ